MILLIVQWFLILVWALSIWFLSIKVSRNIANILDLKKNLDYDRAIKNADLLRWMRRLKLFCVLYVKPFEAIAEYRYKRINDFLIYQEVVDDDGTKLAKMHIRSRPQRKLRQVMKLPDLEKRFVVSCGNLLIEGGLDCVVCISHNRLLSETIIGKRLKPDLNKLSLKITTSTAPKSCLTWIFCDCLLANGLNWFKTRDGFAMFKKIEAAVKIEVNAQG